MFNLGEHSKVRGSGVLILNALRPLTIISLASIMVSSWAMIVLSGLTGKFYFFDTVAHLSVFLFAVFLTITELNLFQRYFRDNWPVFSVSHSLAWLGVFSIMLGCHVLANLDKDKYSQENLGMAIWRLVLASGILAIAFGLFNVVASVIFRDGKNGITARHIRRDGISATADNKATMYDDYSARDAYSRDGYSHNSSFRQEKDEDVSAFRRATRMINPMNLPKNLNFRKSKAQPIHISKPIGQPIISQPIMNYNRDVERGDDTLEDDRRSPLMPSIQRPPTALHPMNTGTSSRYSVANMSRFSSDMYKENRL